MGRTLGLRRIVTTLLVMGTAGAGLAAGAGSVAGGQVTDPNCQVVPPPEAAAAVAVPAECSTLEVTKVVNGKAAEGTIFRVVVSCESTLRTRAADLPTGQFSPFSTVLEFPATGGTREVLIANPSSCTLSETPPPGCTLAGIEPAKVEFTAPKTVNQALVTNNCEAPPPAPVNIQGTIVVTNPPQAVTATPRFTG
jgi:hypothetical protein